IFEILLLKESIDQGNAAGRRRVLFIDGAALHDLGADSVKVSWAHTHPGGAMVALSGHRWRIPIDINALSPIVAFHRAINGKTHLLNARDRGDILMQLTIELLQPFEFVSSHLWINVKNVAVSGIKAEVPMLHVCKAAREQTGCTQQHQRERSLHHYK